MVGSPDLSGYVVAAARERAIGRSHLEFVGNLDMRLRPLMMAGVLVGSIFMFAAVGGARHVAAQSEEIVEPSSNELEIHRNLAFALAAESEYGAAWRHVSVLLDAGEDAWWLHLAAAQICLYWRRDYECVQTHADRTLTVRPQSARAYTLLGQMAQELGEIERAINYYRESLAIRSTESEVSTRLADLLDRSGQRDEAIEVMALARQRNPRDARLMIRMAMLVEETDPDYAETLYTHAVSYHEEPAFAYGHLLRFLERQGRTDEADNVREVLNELVGRRRLRSIR